MSLKYVVGSLTAPIQYMNAEYKLVSDVAQAKTYSVLADAHEALSELFRRADIYVDEQSNYCVTPIWPATFEPPKPKLPPPDFYEVMLSELTADAVLEILSSNTFELGFSGVAEIKGSGQMVINLLTHPITMQPAGREFKFSFTGTMYPAEVEKLKGMAVDDWSGCNVKSYGNGAAAWTVVTLLAEL